MATGCEVLQGFLFSRPLPADRLRDWLIVRDPSSTPVPARMAATPGADVL